LGLAREYLWDDATAEELREEIMRHLCVLVDGGVRDLSAFFGAEAHSEYNLFRSGFFFAASHGVIRGRRYLRTT
jgi:hypothetical protein